MKVVAALFDSEVNATDAMDKLLRQDIKDLDTRVIEAGQNTGGYGSDVGGGPAVPFMPNASGTGSGMSGPGIPATGAGGVFGGDKWLGEIDDEVERSFFMEGMREGATLAMARVHDDDVEHVRQLMRSFGARTYTED